MSNILNKLNECVDILTDYKGNNPYIEYFHKLNKIGKLPALTKNQMDYILTNKDLDPKPINKVVQISDWLGERIQKEHNISFVPTKILVTSLLAESDRSYHVFCKFKQNQTNNVMYFLPKNGVLDLLETINYEETVIDFKKYDNVLVKHGRKLLEHQKEAVKFLHTVKKCILADDQGLGKTTSTITAALEGGYKKVLIICPASLKTNWRDELSFFIDPSEISIIDSSKPYVDNRFTIINYDIIEKYYNLPIEKYEEYSTDKNGNQIVKIKERKSKKKDFIKQCLYDSKLFQSNFELVIIDEGHKLSNSTSMRYKVIDDYIKKGGLEGVFILSGTPITNKPFNYYNVLKLIGADITDNWEYYVKRYCDGKEIVKKDTGRKIWLTSGASNLDELYQKTKHLYLRRVKEDLPNLPEKEIIEKYYNLTEEQRCEYNKLWDEYEQSQIELGKENINRDLIEGIILRQYVSKNMIQNTIELTNKYLDNNEKVVIACSFDDEIVALKEYYGDSAVIYKGGMTIKQKDEAKEKFMNNDNVKIFIGNIIAAGVGLTLTVSHICIFNSFSWVPGDNLQMSDRVHRISQKHDVKIYFQLFKDTISDLMWNTVMRKAMVIDSVIKTEEAKKEE